MAINGDEITGIHKEIVLNLWQSPSKEKEQSILARELNCTTQWIRDNVRDLLAVGVVDKFLYDRNKVIYHLNEDKIIVNTKYIKSLDRFKFDFILMLALVFVSYLIGQIFNIPDNNVDEPSLVVFGACIVLSVNFFRIIYRVLSESERRVFLS
ncbi:MAG TPA: hypothetical protein ENF49_00230 [Candidatus Altiarchaeales archaeon]|nr:hypothetical protein [Candidatus Altiarchaeales archaeon]HEX54545.1 hypothetical protein [Candidatus Altiarchaeales archaeon]